MAINLSPPAWLLAESPTVGEGSDCAIPMPTISS